MLRDPTVEQTRMPEVLALRAGSAAVAARAAPLFDVVNGVARDAAGLRVRSRGRGAHAGCCRGDSQAQKGETKAQLAPLK